MKQQLIQLLINLIALQTKLLFMLKNKNMNEQTENSKRLYALAKSLLYTDITPEDKVSDDVACASSLSQLLRMLGVKGISTGGIASTIALDEFLENSVQFSQVDTPLPGDVCINVTGTGNGNLKHGHVGTWGKAYVMSNDSPTGLWLAGYKHKEWIDYFEVFGGMRTKYYRYI